MTTLSHKHNTRATGYTLIEMLVVIAIIGIIIPVLFDSIASLYESHALTLSRSLALTEATKGMKDVVRDIRASVYAEDGSLPVVTIATSSMTFYADSDLDGRVERVRYFLSGTTLARGIVEPTSTSSYPVSTETTETLASGIMNSTLGTPLFLYYTATGTPITIYTNTLDVRRVSVELVAETTFIRNSGRASLRSSASIRNLKNTY